jgi:hypothetical protein
MREPTGGGTNDVCPVCGRPIRVFRALIMMVWLQPHPQELVQACRLQNRTAHSAAELRQALERRQREGPKTSTQELAYLEERLRQGREALKRLS